MYRDSKMLYLMNKALIFLFVFLYNQVQAQISQCSSTTGFNNCRDTWNSCW